MCMRLAIAAVGVMFAIASDGEVVYSCDSASVAIDSREGIVPIADSATLTYDASWIGGSSSSTIAIEDNGIEVYRKTGSGTYVLPLSGVGRHELTYITYVRGVAQGEVYTATMASIGGTRGSSGSASATVVEDTSVSGGMSVKFSASDSSSSWIEVVTTNACRVDFDWKCSCEPLMKGRPYDYIEFLVDGEQRDFICGETDWTNAVFYVQGSGEHVMKWRFNRDGEGSAGDDCAWVANMTVKPAFELAFSSGEADTGMPPDSIFACEGDMVTLPGQGSLDLSGSHFVGWSVGESIYSSGTRFAVGTNDLAFIAKWDDRTFGEYMNCPYRTFVTSGEAEWVRVQDCSADGLSLRNGAISHSQTSRLETVVFGSGTVKFSCKVGGEVVKGEVYDGLAFCIDGIVQCLIGNVGWTNMTFNVVGDGRHALTWMYVKDGDGNGDGEDCADVDSFSWTADEPLPPLDDMADESDVAPIVAALADSRLVSQVADVATYNELRTWSDNCGISHEAVRDSVLVGPSFALGTVNLLANEPMVSLVDVASAGSSGRSLSVTVCVKDGEEDVLVTAERVAEMFEATSSLSDWLGGGSSNEHSLDIAVEIVRPSGGTVFSPQFRITPMEPTPQQMFLRIRK